MKAIGVLYWTKPPGGRRPSPEFSLCSDMEARNNYDELGKERGVLLEHWRPRKQREKCDSLERTVMRRKCVVLSVDVIKLGHWYGRKRGSRMISWRRWRSKLSHQYEESPSHNKASMADEMCAETNAWSNMSNGSGT